LNLWPFANCTPTRWTSTARGRGLALSIGLIALPYYMHSNPALADISRRQIAEALADQGRVD